MTPATRERWLSAVEAKLTTTDERAYLHRCIAKMSTDHLDRLAATLEVDAAVIELRREMGVRGG